MLGISAAVFSALLIVTGFMKLRRPEETTRALAALGLPSHRPLGTSLGLVELTVGTSALATGKDLLLAAQGILYLGFILWLVAALRLDVPIASCGCLGRPDTPPYWGHLALNLLAVGVSAGAAIESVGPLPIQATTESITGLLVVGVGVFLAWAVINHGARLHGALEHT